MKRRGSDEDDLALLREVCQLLGSWVGKDSYELCIVSAHQRTYLRPSQEGTTFGPALEASLKELLGPDCLTVCEAADAR